jgi:membrane fusion protein, multidrug efflux system
MNKSLKKRYVQLISIAITAAIVFPGCKTSSDNSNKTSEGPLVKTLTVKAKAEGETHAYSGDVKGRYENQMAFQVAGKITGRNVDPGTAVREGDVLMQIDPVDIQQGVDAGKAQVSAAESQYSIAKNNLERFKQLLKENVISKAEFDKYQNSYDSAEAVLRQARAQSAISGNQFGYSRLKADRAGVVSAVYAEAGQVVAAGQPVLALVKGKEREVEINIPENRIQDLNKEQTFKATFWALPGISLEGRLREISPVADAATRTYKARISLVNPPSDLKLGMTATVAMTGRDEQDGIYLPISAIYQTGDKPMVWVVDKNVVALKPVKLGPFAGSDHVQVLEGLRDGDAIVIAGVHKLTEGEKVRIQGADK